jgi:dienelactone hydrolase
MRHISLLAMLVTVVPVFVHAAPPEEPNDLESKAREFLSALAKEDLAAATKNFDEAMKKALPDDKVLDIWKGLVKKSGPFKKLGAARKTKAGKYDIVIVRCEFDKGAQDAQVVFDGAKQLSGLFFRPATDYKAPAYVSKDRFTESKLTVGSGDWALPATLTLPKGEGPFPAVVLVHGSGPQDRDETIGPNKPFRDLAWGLASQGVAVLRYEKRTKEHGAKLAEVKDLTVKEEVLDDALAAVALMRKTPGIDPKNIFVLGHSLGAMSAPRLGQLDPEIKGLILMASPARPIQQVIIEQLEYILSLDKNATDEEKAKIEKMKKDAARLEDPKLLPEELASDKLLGASLFYWKSVRDLDPAATAVKIKQPLFILQGGRDYQVTMVDFGMWTKVLSERKNTQLKEYPKLNHSFMEGEGKAKPAEYDQEGHVVREVIDDIAAWVKKQ